VLEDCSVELVRRALVLLLEPRLVRGHTVARVEARAEEGVGQQGNAFQRQLGSLG
jgi:hypothetical protein